MPWTSSASVRFEKGRHLMLLAFARRHRSLPLDARPTGRVGIRAVRLPSPDHTTTQMETTP
jgi:hypothetical protein